MVGIQVDAVVISKDEARQSRFIEEVRPVELWSEGAGDKKVE